MSVFGLVCLNPGFNSHGILGQDTKLHPHTAPSCDEPLGFFGGKHLLSAVPKNDGCKDDGYW